MINRRQKFREMLAMGMTKQQIRESQLMIAIYNERVFAAAIANGLKELTP